MIFVLRRQSVPTVQLGLLAVWMLAMISIPILRWSIGDEALQWGVVISVCLLVVAVGVILQHHWRAITTLRVMGMVVMLAWALEFVGHRTGFPFGAYYYTAALQPQLSGVPLLVPLAWLMLLPSAWAVGQSITGSNTGWRFVLISAAAFTAWDFFLDPQMVGWGYWVWTTPGGYFGIPWVNFLGWFAGSAAITLLVQPPQVPQAPLLLIYIVTWLLQSMGQAFFWGMPGPALVGFVAMGGFVVWVLLQRTADSRQ